MNVQAPSGLQAYVIENREALLRFLGAHGAGDAAEDLLHELWLRVAELPSGPIAQPVAYLYRAANNLMIDRFRSQRQAVRREQEWTETRGGADPEQSDTPSADRAVIARDSLRRAEAALATLGDRAARVFRRHRLDGIPQREIAAELGVSLSTVESDLRRAYRVMIDFRRTLDEA